MHIYGGGIRAVSRFNPKARLWVIGRKEIFARLKTVFPSGKFVSTYGISGKFPLRSDGADEPRRSTKERVVWIHCASLGEFEQGRPVIEAIRTNYPQYKILLTFFSPSGYEIRKNYQGVDYIFYLPLDTPRNVRKFLDIVEPEIAIFVKYEYWLNYLTELGRRGCRTFLISAIFRPDQIFFKRAAGAPFRRALATYERIFVQNEQSRELLASIGITNVSVAGDTRFDRVARIAESARRLPIVERFASGQPLFVAGSTWEPDERILQQLVNSHPEIKFIIAPHEMEPSRIASLMANTIGGAVRYTEADAARQTEADKTSNLSDNHLLIVDTIGILSSIYGYASFAYIGGGFGAGIHNTLEAATFGLPMAFGPNYRKFKEAQDLITSGAAVSISNYAELDAWFTRLLADPFLYGSLRQASSDYVAAHKGATGIIMRAIFHSNTR